MNTTVYATCHWVLERQRILSEIEKSIDDLLGVRTTGAFVVELRGPMGSRNSNVKELKA